jgi:hypothetical protein
LLCWRDAEVRRCLLRALLERDDERAARVERFGVARVERCGVARVERCGDRELPVARLGEALLRAGVLPFRRVDPDRLAAERVAWAMLTHLPPGCYDPCLGSG